MSQTLITSRDPKGQQTMRLLEATYDKMRFTLKQAQCINERGNELVSGFENLLTSLVNRQVHIVDCIRDPFIPRDNWTIEYHDTSLGPQFELDVSKFELYLSDNQVGSQISGNELRKELENKPVLNANVLDYLLAHPELIPEEWKEKYIFFWGTIYRSSDGYLCVRDLCWVGVGWDWRCCWLTRDWNSDDPAVVLASN